MTPDLPDTIATYQHAHDQHDTSTAITTFSADATVIDDGHTYSGTDQIRAWLDHTANEYSYTRTLTGIDDHGNGTYTVHNHLTGNFPGEHVDLHYQFELHNNLIHLVRIAP